MDLEQHVNIKLYLKSNRNDKEAYELLQSVYWNNGVTLKAVYSGMRDLKAEINRLKTSIDGDVLRPQKQTRTCETDETGETCSLKESTDYTRVYRKTEHVIWVRANHFRR